MAYLALKTAIAQVIRQNGNKEITGNKLLAQLFAMIDSLGAGYLFMGVATPATTPGTPDQKVYYIGAPGTYANFGSSVTVPEGSIIVFKYDSAWSSLVVKIAEPVSVSQNSQTGKITITVGNNSYDVASAAAEVVEDGLYITDPQGYIGAKVTEFGLEYVNMVNIKVSNTEYIINSI